MKIAFILHDLSLTGASKLGLQMATIFARRHQVTLVAKKDGPLRGTVSPDLFEDIVVTGTNHEICSDSLEARIASATAWLRNSSPDLVYVNSIAAADWVGAARRGGIRNVLHVHEMAREISGLLLVNAFDSYDIGHADRVLAASRECLSDLRTIFGLPNEKLTDFGICVDVADIWEKAKQAPAQAVRHDGRSLDYDRIAGRKIVAMCGLAQFRKGTDLFWETAHITPEHDFLWLGPWDDPEMAKVNPALSLNAQVPLDNFYWTNMMDNPYGAMAQIDLLTLTSREDPNPLVVPEAIALGLPVLTFVDTGGSHEWTSRYGISLSGVPDPNRLSVFLRRFFSMKRPDWNPEPSFLVAVDLENKTSELMKELE